MEGSSSLILIELEEADSPTVIEIASQESSRDVQPLEQEVEMQPVAEEGQGSVGAATAARPAATPI
eukprot:11168248-Lingulodinium_polyedra.AAC.1